MQNSREIHVSRVPARPLSTVQCPLMRAPERRVRRRRSVGDRTCRGPGRADRHSPRASDAIAEAWM